MVEKIEEVRSELETVLVFEGEPLGHEEVPLLLERTTDLRDIAAEVAKDGADVRTGAWAANGEGLIPWATEGI